MGVTWCDHYLLDVDLGCASDDGAAGERLCQREREDGLLPCLAALSKHVDLELSF